MTKTLSVCRRAALLLLAFFVSWVALGEAQAAPSQTGKSTSVSSKSRRRAAARRSRRSRRTTPKVVTKKVVTPVSKESPPYGVVISDRNEADVDAAPTSVQPKSQGPIVGGVLNGKAISRPAPAYPAIAKAARASGAVVVQILVDENGDVISAQAVSGHPLLQQSAVSAVRQWKFTPTLLSGQPVKVTGRVIVNYNLQ